MSISVRNRKILWAKAGNQCAFLGCWQALVVTSDDIGPTVVVGHEAHIVSGSPDGPRGHDMMPEEGVDSYDNVILLCPTHHTIVDGAPDIFTRHVMIDMKRTHESRIRSSLHVQPTQSHDLHLPARTSAYAGDVVNSWKIGESTVVVWSYGSPPLRLANGHWRASGISIGQLHAGVIGDVHRLFDSSEAQPDIEYWVSESKFCVLQETFLYDQDRFVPFLRHDFDFTTMPASSSVAMLLTPDPTMVSRLPEIVRAIESFDRDTSIDRLYVLLYQMWKVGLSEPREVRIEFQRFRGAWWYDGASAETVASMSDELALVERVLASTPRGM